MKTILFFCTLLLSQAAYAAQTVHLTSLSWPPYSDRALKEQGAAVAVAKAAFAAMGYQLEVEFYPWTRAVKLAQDAGSKYAGYFPEYHYDTTDFVFSDSMGKGPLGLVEQTAKPITWQAIDDLSRYTIGVVQDYVNTAELDERIVDKRIPSQTATSDDQNVQKVAAGRIDAAVIDANVLHHLLQNDSRLKPLQSKVQMNTKLLTDKDLHIAFKNTPEGDKLRAVFNEGLTKIDAAAIMKQYLN